MKLIGLTGGIASGKSKASDYLKKRGFVIIDADHIARRIVEVGEPAYLKIKAYFGEDYFDEKGVLDRKALGARVFANASDLAVLNEITHPMILEEIERQIEKMRCQKDIHRVILDAALFFELRLERLVDEVWYIDASTANQIKRMIQRDGLTEEQGAARIQSQWEASKKKALAQVVIDNNGTLENLYRQLEDHLK